MNTSNVILLPDSVFWITPLRTMGLCKVFLAPPHRTVVLGLSKNVILSTPMRVFFVFFLAARHPADFDGRPTAGAKALASVSLIPWHPCHSRPALHRRVPFLRCEHSISVSARHFLVTRFRWRSVCLSDAVRSLYRTQCESKVLLQIWINFPELQAGM